MQVQIQSDTLSAGQRAYVDAILAASGELHPGQLGPLLLSLAVVAAQECGMTRAAFLDAATNTFDNTHLLSTIEYRSPKE